MKDHQLQTLLPEVLSLIAQHLADIHLPSLLKLTFLSKSLYAACLPAAKRFFFQTIILPIDSHAWVQHDVDHILAHLSQANALHSVHRLAIYGCDLDSDNRSPGAKQWSPPTLKSFSFDKPEEAHETNFSYKYATQEGVYIRLGSCRWPDLDEPHRSNKYWEPVAELIRRLPLLRDLHFSCYVQFPPCLLEALHTSRPGCRLHLHCFWLRSAMVPETDEYEFRLITSPSLHTIMMRYDLKRLVSARFEGYDLYEGHNYQKFGLRRILGLAPNLKVVYLVHGCEEEGAPEFPQWEYFAQEPFSVDQSLPLAKLERLEIHSTPVVEPMTLYKWADYVDFAALRSLDLFEGMRLDALEFWADRADFPRLERLALDISPGLVRGHPTAFYEALRQLICCLPPLVELELKGWHSGLPVEVIAEHGVRLRKLVLECHIWQPVAAEGILSLGTHCPLLEDLTITIQRSQGDKSEVAAYRALGTIRRLKYLSLTLDLSDKEICGDQFDLERWRAQHNTAEYIVPPPDPSLDDIENRFSEQSISVFFKTRNSHARRLLINCAIDKDLVSSIFATISSTKAADTWLLQRMTLKMRGHSMIMEMERDVPFNRDDPFNMTAYWMSSSWTVTRDLRWEHRHGWAVDGRSGHPQGRHRLQSWLAVIFRRIWPEESKTREVRRYMTKRWEAKTDAARGGRAPNIVQMWDDTQYRSFPLDLGKS